MHVLQIYEGKIDPWVMSDNCTDNVPVLIKRATFCSAFAADARDFRQYNSWVRFRAMQIGAVVRVETLRSDTGTSQPRQPFLECAGRPTWGD